MSDLMRRMLAVQHVYLGSCPDDLDPDARDPAECRGCIELDALDAAIEALLQLRDAANAMMALLGYHGTISADDDRAQAVMDALAEVDRLRGEGPSAPLSHARAAR